MKQTAINVPGILEHMAENEADLVKEMRTYVGAQPGVRFLADVLGALHAPGSSLRDARGFYTNFAPMQVLQALRQRPDLRVRLVRAITGGPPALLRRQNPADLASQIELLVADDLPASERGMRAEEDRNASVPELYLKYLDPTDVATYLPASALWRYEGHDRWWTGQATAATRALMAAELKSIRRHEIIGASELLDLIGDEAIERDLPLAVRTMLRAAARKAAREGRPFRDNDMFTCVQTQPGQRDLTDELCESLSLLALRKVVDRAAEILGWTTADPNPAVDSPPATAAPVRADEGPRAKATPAPLRTAAASPPARSLPEPAKPGAAPGRPSPPKPADPFAPSAARRPSADALTPVSGIPIPIDPILVEVDEPFALDHHPNFGDVIDSDTVFTLDRSR